MRKRDVLIFIFFIATTSVWGQAGKDTITFTDILRLSLIDSGIRSYPLTRDTTGKFPEHLEVTGKIVDITTGTSCGTLCGCGTIKVKLATPLKNYIDSCAFIAIPCFNVNDQDYLNKTIKIKVKLLDKENKDCYWNEAPLNYINSKGTPFYIPDNLDEKLHLE